MKNDDIETLKTKFDLEESGKYLVGKCPFHQEKTPSFMIDPKKEIYHCFGCGRDGPLDDLINRGEY